MPGLLNAVSNLTVTVGDSIASLTWKAPFSLDVPLYDPDIDGYCVFILETNKLVHAECGIPETNFSYQLPPNSGCHNYTFTVTPVNAVGNGTNLTVFHHGNEPSKHLADLISSPHIRTLAWIDLWVPCTVCDYVSLSCRSLKSVLSYSYVMINDTYVRSYTSAPFYQAI